MKKKNQSLEEVQRVMFWRSVYVLCTPLFMIFAILACTGTALTGVPRYTCPTPVPLATSTTLPGTPLPTAMPTVTPYIIQPPQDFYLGDAVIVGAVGSPQRVGFRLRNVVSSGDLHTWELEVANLGSEDYEIFPAVQMVLSEVETAYGTESGAWASTQDAAEVAGIEIDRDVYTLQADDVRVFAFAAFAPEGRASRFTFTLDPTVTEGSAVITWTSQHNPYC